jgi:hypothetical protein
MGSIQCNCVNSLSGRSIIIEDNNLKKKFKYIVIIQKLWRGYFYRKIKIIYQAKVDSFIMNQVVRLEFGDIPQEKLLN